MARAKRDERTQRQSWSHNPLVSQSDAALRQAVAPFLDWAKLRKNITNKFNDKGRPDNVSEWVDFQCIITQEGDRSRRATAGGDRSEANFIVAYLAPVKLMIGDIVKHETFGLMKIEGYNGLTNMGLTSARAVGLNATEDIEDGSAVRDFQEELF